jgi:hypothetical protein
VQEDDCVGEEAVGHGGSFCHMVTP